MKTFMRRTALTSLAILFLLGGTSAAFANPQNQQGSQKLSLTVPLGGVTNLGNQAYTVSGGQVVFAEVAGLALNPGATIYYNFMATQTGMNTRGYAYMRITGTAPNGAPVSMSGNFNIDGNVPIGVVGNSELPFFFTTATSNVQVTVAGSTQTIPESLEIESPYFNPFGNPILLASPDGVILIAATYDQGTIVWSGSQVSGPVVGTLGSTQVTGTVSDTTNEFENLVQGTASDVGTTQFTGMTPSSLDVSGNFHGTSTIPTTGTIDCTSLLQLPFPATGLCTETGFQSTGQFRAGPISGIYTTIWSTPAVEYTSSITATVSQYGQH